MWQFVLFLYQLMCISAYCSNNFCFVSTYIYECMINFVCSIYILYVQQIMCITNFVFSNFSLNVWQLLFLWQFVYELMCTTTYSFLLLMCTHLYIYDNLCIWQILFLVELMHITCYAFCGSFVFTTTYKYFLGIVTLYV